MQFGKLSSVSIGAGAGAPLVRTLFEDAGAGAEFAGTETGFASFSCPRSA